jgi:hypothetical protein
MKKDDLVKIIRAIVKQEIKKELPNALAQVFTQMMGQTQPQMHGLNVVRNVPKSEPPFPQPETPEDEIDSLKGQLQEMLSHGLPVRAAAPQSVPASKKFTNNPLLNEVLNQTRPFNGSERMANRVGGGGAMSQGVMMAAHGYDAPQASTTGVGQLMDNDELSFLNNIPGMPGADVATVSQLPVANGRGFVGEGQAPLAALPETISALDIRNHPALPSSIKSVLTRDYRSLVRAMDKKKPK